MFYKKIFFVLDVLLKINIFKSILLYKIYIYIFFYRYTNGPVAQAVCKLQRSLVLT